MKITTHNIRSYIILSFLLSSIALPQVGVLGLGLYLTTVFSPFLLFYLISIKAIAANKFFFHIMFLGLMVVISSLYSNSVGLTTHTSRNYIESIKYLQFIPYLLTLKLNKDNRVFKKILDIFSLFFVLIFLIQWLNLFNLKEFIVNIYLDKESSHTESVLNNWRLSLTGSGPNEGAAIAAFFLIYNFTQFLNRPNIRYLTLTSLTILSIFLTQSRTVLIGTILSVIIVISISKIRVLYKILIASISFTFILFILSSFDLEYIKVGFELAETGDNNSVNMRLDRLNHAYEYFSKSPILGFGPAKNELSTVVDSEYVLILQRYAILGIFLFSYLLLSLLIYSYKNRMFLSGRILFSYTTLTLIIMLTNNAYSGYQLMSITIFLLLWISTDNKGVK